MKFFLLLTFLICATRSIAWSDEPVSKTSTNTVASITSNKLLHDTSPVSAPEPSEKAMSFYRSGNVVWCMQTFWDFLIPALFLFTGFSGKLQAWAQRWGHKWYFIFALYYVAFAFSFWLVNLPLDYYLGFVRLHDYDLSNQTFNKWFDDALKQFAVLVVAGLAVWWFPFLLIRKSPQRWWLYTGLLAVPFLCLTLLIWPVLIDPLFNKFQPLQNKVMEAKILALADRAGIEGSRVYEVNKSVDTKTLNAYVNGFMDTKRIVLWDNTLRTLDEDELLFVMAHEMGHYVLKHIINNIVFSSLMIFVALYATHRLSGLVIRRFKRRFGFSSLSDFAALPLIILWSQLFSFIGDPVQMAFSRHQEHEADRFGLELTHNNHAAATAFLKLQQHNLSNPRPGKLYILWRSSHPPIGERIDFCNSYRPWEMGEPLRYGKYIKAK